MSYKNKIILGLATILLMCGLLIALRFVFGLFTPFNFLTARQDIRNGTIRVAETGELPVNSLEKEALARSCGFTIVHLGCSVSTDIQNGVSYYNRVMITHLENKYGKGFWIKFQSRLDSIDKSRNLDLTLEKVTDLVAGLKIVKDQVRLVDSLSGHQRHISLIPVLEDSLTNRYLVKVAEDNGTNYVTYFNFVVDGNTMKIINPDGK
jgi:hypothetical protein